MRRDFQVLSVPLLQRAINIAKTQLSKGWYLIRPWEDSGSGRTGEKLALEFRRKRRLMVLTGSLKQVQPRRVKIGGNVKLRKCLQSGP